MLFAFPPFAAPPAPALPARDCIALGVCRPTAPLAFDELRNSSSWRGLRSLVASAQLRIVRGMLGFTLEGLSAHVLILRDRLPA